MWVDSIKMALHTIMSDKIRSGLSMLGIVIGVLTIVLVVAIGQGAQQSIEEQYKNLSVTTIMVMPVNTESSQSALSAQDAEIILEQASYVDQATPILQGKLPISTDTDSEQFTILGVRASFAGLSNLHYIQWTGFDSDDDDSKATKVVLWYGVYEELFTLDQTVIGQEIVIGRKRFEIVGVFEPSGATVGPISYDDTVFIPYTTADKVILGSNGIIRLIALATDIDSIDLAMGEMGDVLREEHRLRAVDPDDFRLRDQWSKVVAAQESAQTMSMLLMMVAGIVLVVSGIGIMNVMFAGVAERTKEIGILKSIGAKRSDILQQFLIESIVLTLLAGILGVMLGELIVPMLDGVEGMMMIRSTLGDIIAFGFAVFVGVFFGRYPAYQASKLDPVDALRS